MYSDRIWYAYGEDGVYDWEKEIEYPIIQSITAVVLIAKFFRDVCPWVYLNIMSHNRSNQIKVSEANQKQAAQPFEDLSHRLYGYVTKPTGTPRGTRLPEQACVN